MLSSYLDTLLKVSKTTSPQKLFVYDCVTLYHEVCLANLESRFQPPTITKFPHLVFKSYTIQHQKQGISKALRGGGVTCPCPPPHGTS